MPLVNKSVHSFILYIAVVKINTDLYNIQLSDFGDLLFVHC